jgi:hypothetical protein
MRSSGESDALVVVVVVVVEVSMLNLCIMRYFFTTM